MNAGFPEQLGSVAPASLRWVAGAGDKCKINQLLDLQTRTRGGCRYFLVAPADNIVALLGCRSTHKHRAMTTPTEPASATSIEGPRRSPAPGVIDWHNHPLVQSIELPFNLPSRIYGAMLALWHYHRFLQRRFPLHENQPRGFLQLLAWCTLIGRRNHHLLRQIPDWDSELGAPATLPELKGDRWAGSFSVGQLLIGIAHYHYTVTPMLRDVRARDRVARLYWRGERIATKCHPHKVGSLPN